MKVIFLCNSLEPGRDGVGDYTRRLAFELIKHSYLIAIIALNDKLLNIDEVEEINAGADQFVNTLRLSSRLRWNKRIKKASNYIDKFNPEWVSLQYVPYGFQNKGIPFGLSKRLKTLLGNRNCHIMFHEIWQGESIESSYKDKIIGILQKKICFSLIKALKPKWISTTNDYYKGIFEKSEVSIIKIPVFSNLPVGINTNTEILKYLLPNGIYNKRHQFLIATFFGGMSFSTDLGNKILLLAKFANSQNKQLYITHIGKYPEAESILSKINKETGILFSILGERDGQVIADYLSKIDIGISTYPKILFEKSGSIAAMLNNNLPVILFKESFEKYENNLSELKDIDELNHFNEFTAQPKIFGELYGINHAIKMYIMSFESY